MIPYPFEFEHHGVECPDTFPGAGVCLTPFEHVVTGIGTSERSACYDALRLAAEAGFPREFLMQATILADSESDYDLTCPDEEAGVYVSFRW